MDSHRESHPEIGRGWKVKKTFTTYPHSGLGVSALSSSVVPSLTGNLRVSNCVHQIGLNTKARLVCPSCGNTDWQWFIFDSDLLVTDPDTVGYTVIMCVYDRSTNPPRVVPSGPCRHEASLYEFMHPSERRWLHNDVADWMQKKGIPNPLHSANMFPSPHATATPSFQDFVVVLMIRGHRFECKITLQDPLYRAPPTIKEAEQYAERLYGPDIKDYVQSGGQTPLPSTVRHINANKAAQSVAVPTLSENEVEQRAQLERMGYSSGQIDALMSSNVGENPLVNGYTCEADKPEGTRDPDKFLKEQQDKLWRGE